MQERRRGGEAELDSQMLPKQTKRMLALPSAPMMTEIGLMMWQMTEYGL